MKLLKLITIAALATIGAFAMVTYSSCTDACKDVACLNGGACQDGKCVCPAGFMGNNCEKTLCTGIDCKNGGECKDGKCLCQAGYEGDRCETLTAQKFLGQWKGGDDCAVSGWPHLSYTWNIEQGVTKSDVKIFGWKSSTGVGGVIKSSAEIDIPQQPWDTYGNTIKGTIKYDNGKLNVTYTIDQGTCTGTYNR
jgi:hypothetical protein